MRPGDNLPAATSTTADARHDPAPLAGRCDAPAQPGSRGPPGIARPSHGGNRRGQPVNHRATCHRPARQPLLEQIDRIVRSKAAWPPSGISSAKKR